MVITWYLVIVNIIAFVFMGIDKRRAVKKKWRIPENRLWLMAIVGGSIGAMIGMSYFRHKTKHRLFKIGMPIILIVQIVIVFIAV
ncbi:hypothetical protein CFK40_08440 [Virgibacillus necropolis]|uniref:DUF1294 domain-containing protein n=2 Tax=Virgibacillus necropolis TaxID=163877 RepID=A0A221MI50_9BACI|nr:DUF1294 domain-containing protein [Virgibacillus necropolis]ASN07343.1 hypothetical protein CFK40_08440 [Virgibacillus necropolis]